MGSGQVEMEMDLKQDGAKVTGPVTVSGPTSAEPTNFAGTVSVYTITLDAAHGSGTLTVKGDEMTGMVYGIMPAYGELEASEVEAGPGGSSKRRQLQIS